MSDHELSYCRLVILERFGELCYGVNVWRFHDMKVSACVPDGIFEVDFGQEAMDSGCFVNIIVESYADAMASIFEQMGVGCYVEKTAGGYELKIYGFVGTGHVGIAEDMLGSDILRLSGEMGGGAGLADIKKELLRRALR